MIARIACVHALTMIFFFLIIINNVEAAYIAGAQPHTFQEGEEIHLLMNSLTSQQTLLPKDSYELPFCRPLGGAMMQPQTTGEFLVGNKIQLSPYNTIRMKEQQRCQILCQVPSLRPIDAETFQYHIQYGYHHNWIVDDLPAAYKNHYDNSTSNDFRSSLSYTGGFPIGHHIKEKNETIIYNHVDIHIEFKVSFHVVGFYIEPKSIDYNTNSDVDSKIYNPRMSCPRLEDDETNHVEQPQTIKVGEPLLFTYNIIWHSRSDFRWSNRWDMYFIRGSSFPPSVRWNAFLRGFVLNVFLFSLVLALVRRVPAAAAGKEVISVVTAPHVILNDTIIHQDENSIHDDKQVNTIIDKNEQQDDDESHPRKLLSPLLLSSPSSSLWHPARQNVILGPPLRFPVVYCVLLGSGAHLTCTLGICIGFTLCGYMDPVSRGGSFLQSFLLTYMFTGPVAGYVSSRLCKTFRLGQWRHCKFMTALLAPGIAFSTFLIINLLCAVMEPSTTILAPILETLILAAMWFVQGALTFWGSMYGYKAEAMKLPTTTTTTRNTPTIHTEEAKEISRKASYFLLPLLMEVVLGGWIPFAFTTVEVSAVLSGMWKSELYCAFGFTLLISILLCTTCTQVALLNHFIQQSWVTQIERWWWSSFFSSGGAAVYLFLYCILWFHENIMRLNEETNMSAPLMTYILYFGYMSLICLMMMLILGTVGVFGVWYFLYHFYASN